MHVNKNCLTTILSLKDVTNIPGLCVTMHTSMEKAMDIMMKDGKFFKIKKSGVILL